jgi:chromosome segregation ATPase
MNKTLQRIIGIILIITAIGGWLFSIFGVISIWRIKPQLTESLTNSLALTSDTLDATSRGLDLARDSFDIAVSSLNALQNTLDATATAFEASSPMFDTLITISNDNLPKSIEAIQNAMEGAKASAEVIDGVLRVLTIFNSSLYNPEVPMQDSLQEISDSLDSLPEAFTTMEDSLSTTQESMEEIKSEIESVSSDLDDIQTSIKEFDTVLVQYQELVKDLQGKIDSLQSNLDKYLTSIAILLTLFFIWMIAAQLGLFTQGLERLKTDVAEAVTTTASPDEVEVDQTINDTNTGLEQTPNDESPTEQ